MIPTVAAVTVIVVAAAAFFKTSSFTFFTLIAPPEIQVTCFNGADNLQEVLADFTNEIQWDNTNEVVKKCAQLAHSKDYKIFALGQNGLCLSGPDTRHRYYINGVDGAYCKDGVGMGNSMFVYALGMAVYAYLMLFCLLGEYLIQEAFLFAILSRMQINRKESKRTYKTSKYNGVASSPQTACIFRMV